jgi:thioredoxin 1
VGIPVARAGDSVPRDAPPPERIVQEALTVSRKSKTNFPLNAAMFLLMSCMVSSGLLMKYVLLPGSQRQEKFGRNVDLFLFGMDRHDWGTVHLVMGLLLIALLAVHIVLHWKEITGVFSKRGGFPGLKDRGGLDIRPRLRLAHRPSLHPEPYRGGARPGRRAGGAPGTGGEGPMRGAGRSLRVAEKGIFPGKGADPREAKVRRAVLLSVMTIMAAMTLNVAFLAKGARAQVPQVPVRGMVTMVDLGANQCVPCKMMAPILEKLEKVYRGKAAIVVIDVWKYRDQAQRFRIRAIPTQIFFDREGKEVYRHVGFMSEKEIVEQLRKMGVQ